MNAKVETEGSGLDTVKLVASIALLAGAVVAFYYFSDRSLLLRVLGLLAVTGVSLGIMATTAVGARTMGYFSETRAEVRKMVWPTRQETMQTALIVFAMVIILGIMLWLMDMFFLWLVKLVTGQGG